MKELRCRDAGVDCDFVARGETEKEVVRQAEEHARRDHKMQVIPKEMEEKMRSLIRDAR